MSPPGPICSSQPVPASQDRFHRTSVKRCGFHDPECLPSTGAPSGPACAGHRGARHRSRDVAVYEPASGDPLRLLLNFRQVPARAAPLRQFARKLHSLRPEAFAPNVRQIGFTACQLLQSLRFLSTTCGHDHHPASFAGGCPPALLSCGQRQRLSTCRWPSHRGFRGCHGLYSVDSASQPKRGSFAPTSISPDTSCHDPVSAPGGEARRRVYGT
jgi:hypothetical protein